MHNRNNLLTNTRCWLIIALWLLTTAALANSLSTLAPRLADPIYIIRISDAGNLYSIPVMTVTQVTLSPQGQQHKQILVQIAETIVHGPAATKPKQGNTNTLLQRWQQAFIGNAQPEVVRLDAMATFTKAWPDILSLITNDSADANHSINFIPTHSLVSLFKTGNWFLYITTDPKPRFLAKRDALNPNNPWSKTLFVFPDLHVLNALLRGRYTIVTGSPPNWSQLQIGSALLEQIGTAGQIFVSRAYPTERIIQYPNQPFGANRSQRLVVNLKLFQIPDPVQEARLLQLAFLPVSIQDNQPKELAAVDFRRLRSISIDATQPHIVNGTHFTVKVPISNNSLTTQTLALKATNPYLTGRYCTRLMGRCANATVTDNHTIDRVPFPKEAANSPGFAIVADTTTKNASNGIRYPAQIRSIRYSNAAHSKSQLLFTLVDGQVPLYVQDREVTIEQWQTFLQAQWDTYQQDPLDNNNYWYPAVTQPTFKAWTGQSLATFLNKPSDEKSSKYIAASVILERIRVTPLANSNANSKIIKKDPASLKLATRIAARAKDLPMTAISPQAAQQFATWIDSKARLMTEREWSQALSAMGKQRPFIAGKLAAAKTLGQASIRDFSNALGGKVYGLYSNAAELVVAKQGEQQQQYTIVGAPYMHTGTWWHGLFTNPGNLTKSLAFLPAHQDVGFRIILPTNTQTPQDKWTTQHPVITPEITEQAKRYLAIVQHLQGYLWSEPDLSQNPQQLYATSGIAIRKTPAKNPAPDAPMTRTIRHMIYYMNDTDAGDVLVSLADKELLKQLLQSIYGNAWRQTLNRLGLSL